MNILQKCILIWLKISQSIARPTKSFLLILLDKLAQLYDTYKNDKLSKEMKLYFLAL